MCTLEYNKFIFLIQHAQMRTGAMLTLVRNVCIIIIVSSDEPREFTDDGLAHSGHMSSFEGRRLDNGACNVHHNHHRHRHATPKTIPWLHKY